MPMRSSVLNLCLASAIGITTAAFQAFAGEPASNPPLKVGVSPIFPPMVFKQNGNLAGVEVDLARAFGEYLGRPVTFVELPWKDQIDAVNQGRIDIIMSSMSVTTAR